MGAAAMAGSEVGSNAARLRMPLTDGDEASPVVGGSVAPGLEGVAKAFQENFAVRGELGAAFVVYVGGESVVDLWGGFADRSEARLWQRDTLVPIFSGTKGLVAVCMLMLLERGELELEQPVCHYWPQFGKEQIRVRDVVSHTSRLPGVETPVSLQEFLDASHMAKLLATQLPSADPRAERYYHPFTFGWLCGELIRRIDGRSIGRFFAEEVAQPLDLELWIGLPVEQEGRVAVMELAPDWPTNPFLDPTTHADDMFLWSVWANPPVMLRATFPWNRHNCHAAEIPGAGAIGTARAVAKLYDNLTTLLAPEALELATHVLSEGAFGPEGQPRRYGVGFQLNSDQQPFGPPTSAYGHPGAGGSVHGCWPRERTSFSYAMNLMIDDESADARATALLKAVYEVVR